jgi:putative membrane protein
MALHRRASVIFVIVLATLPTYAMADVGARTTPDGVWSSWSFDPLVLFSLFLSGWIYWRGLLRLHQRARRTNAMESVHATCFYAALVLIGLSLLSPLDALSQELSSAHMTQHMLLMMVAAPLMVLGSPSRVIPYAMSPLWQELTGLTWLTHRATWHPTAIWVLFVIALWGWHHPLLYQAALRDPLVHDAQHLSFFAAAFLFWRIVLDPFSRRRMHATAAAVFLFTTSIHASALGVFLALAPSPWYLEYASRTVAFGFTPMADQQLAGLIMWVPGCWIYPLIAVGLLARWLIVALEGEESMVGAHPT